MRALAVVLFAGALLFNSVADAAVSRLKLERGVDAASLAAYDDVVVTDALVDHVKRYKKDHDDEASFRRDVALVGQRIADRIAERLRESGKYESVSRGGADAAGDAPAVVIDGELTMIKRANVATRYLGLGAGSKLKGNVFVKDSAGKPLGTIRLNFSSSGIPGFTNLVQTIDAFIEGIAVRVADEVMVAQGKLHRAETGRSARLREKYSD